VEETRGNAITQPRSHPIKKMYSLGMGWDRGTHSSTEDPPNTTMF